MSGRALEILEIQMQILADMQGWVPDTATHFPLTVLEAQVALADVAAIIVQTERNGLEVTDEVRVNFAKALGNLFRFTCLAAVILDIKLEEAYKLVRSELVAQYGEPRRAGEFGEATSPE